MLVERGELNEWTIYMHSIPSVVADNYPMRHEKNIMVWLLKGLRDGVQFALVRTGVVGLRFSRNGAYEIRVNAQGEAHDVDSLLDVRFPVPTLFAGGNGGDADFLLLFAIGRLVEL